MSKRVFNIDKIPPDVEEAIKSLESILKQKDKDKDDKKDKEKLDL